MIDAFGALLEVRSIVLLAVVFTMLLIVITLIALYEYARRRTARNTRRLDAMTELLWHNHKVAWSAHVCAVPKDQQEEYVDFDIGKLRGDEPEDDEPETPSRWV